jgi:hypothetical protein
MIFPSQVNKHPELLHELPKGTAAYQEKDAGNSHFKI